MVGYAGSPIYTVYVDVTLTRSKVKVNVTGLLNFRQLAKPYAGGDDRSPLAGLSGMKNRCISPLTAITCSLSECFFSGLTGKCCRCAVHEGGRVVLSCSVP